MTSLNNVRGNRCVDFFTSNNNQNINQVDTKIQSVRSNINRDISHKKLTTNCCVESSPDIKVDKQFKITQLKKYFKPGVKINKRAFFSTLKLVFGKRLAKKIKSLPRFKSDHEIKILNSSSLTISKKDAFLALLAIGQHVSTEEINNPNYIVNHGHEHQSLEELAREAKNPSSYLEIGNLDTLMNKFHVAPKDLQSIHSTNNYVNNLNIEKNDFKQEIIPYKSTEVLARDVSYIKPESFDDGTIISFFNKDVSQIRFYYLKEQLHDNGLHAYYFKPLSGKTDEPGLLLFRGTKGWNSLKRDINIKADTVGKKVFDRNQRRLLEMTQDSTSLNVIGHSLGGADVQRYLLASALDHKKKQVTGYAYCAPKLDQRTLDDAINLGSDSHTHLSIYFAHHQDDLVAKAGHQYIGKEVGIKSQTFISSQSMPRVIRPNLAFFLGDLGKLFDYLLGCMVHAIKRRLRAHCTPFFSLCSQE